MTLREDIREAIEHFAEMNIEKSKAQSKKTFDGLCDAMRYKIRAETAHQIAPYIMAVLSKHHE